MSRFLCSFNIMFKPCRMKTGSLYFKVRNKYSFSLLLFHLNWGYLGQTQRNKATSGAILLKIWLSNSCSRISLTWFHKVFVFCSLSSNEHPVPWLIWMLVFVARKFAVEFCHFLWCPFCGWAFEDLLFPLLYQTWRFGNLWVMNDTHNFIFV